MSRFDGERGRTSVSVLHVGVTTNEVPFDLWRDAREPVSVCARREKRGKLRRRAGHGAFLQTSDRFELGLDTTPLNRPGAAEPRATPMQFRFGA